MAGIPVSDAVRTYHREKNGSREEILSSVAESVRFVSHLDTRGRSVFDGDKDSPLTDEVRDDWVALALTGALVPRQGEASSLFLALDTSVPYPLVHPGRIILSQETAMCSWHAPEGIFETVREVLRDENPELLAEVARQQYERVWPGWTDGLDMVHVVMRAEGSFWEPLITEALEKWAGNKVRYDMCGGIADVEISLQGLLMFGKTTVGRLSESELMAAMGGVCKTLPELVTDKPAGQAPLIVCGNGSDTVLPSPAEYAAVLYELTGQYVFFHESVQHEPMDVPDWQDLRFALRRAREKEMKNKKSSYST